jgi:hypothetical protein
VTRGLVWAVAVLLALAAWAGGAAAAVHGTGSCSTHGLTASSVRVVELRVHGVTCSQARKVAGGLASDLAHGRTVSVSGAESFSMSQATCTGCKTTTSVSIGYRSGTMIVSLRGGSGPSSGTVPTLPAPSFGTGSPTTVI